MNDIIIQDDNFQKYLLENHYTFIGHKNLNLLEPFIKTVNQIAPANIFHTIHDALSNRKATRVAIQYLPANTELRIYVIIPADSQVLFHLTGEEYREKFKI